MTSLNFSNFYRFVVSVGAGLVLVAAGLPWLVLREGFGFAIPVRELNQLTIGAQVALIERQSAGEQMQRALPWVCVPMGSVGLIILAWGMWRWWQLQKLLDIALRHRVDKLGLDVALTQRQIHAKAATEILEQDNVADAGLEQDLSEPRQDSWVQPITPVEEAPIAPRLKKYLSIESLVIKRLKECLAREYNVKAHWKIGTFEADAVLIGKNSRTPGLLVEIKYLTRSVPMTYFYQAIHRLVQGSQESVRQSNRQVRPVLVIVGGREIVTGERFERMRQNVAQLMAESTSRGLVRFWDENDLERMTCEELRATLDPITDGGLKAKQNAHTHSRD